MMTSTWRTRMRWLAGMAWLSMTVPASAQITAPAVPDGVVELPDASLSQSRAQGDSFDFEIGGRLLPSLDARFQYTDNFYNQPDTEDDVFGATISPSLNYVNQLSRFRAEADASADFGIFDSVSDEDNYEDLSLSAGVNWLPASRHYVAFGLKYLLEHDPFGTLRTESNPVFVDRELDKWNSEIAEMKYRYGGAQSRTQFEIGLLTRSKEYTSNESSIVGGVEVGTRFFDYDNFQGDFTLLYFLSPKTALVLNAVLGTTDFEEVFLDDPALDSSNDEQRYRTGVRWQATGKTSASLLVGYFERQFDGDLYDDFDAVDWQGSLTWTPSTVDTITVQTGRSGQESYRAGTAFIDNRNFGVNWLHTWNPRFFTRAAASYIESEFVGGNRDDEYLTVNLSAQYQMLRWLAVVGGGTYFERESNEDLVSFDKTNAYLGVRIQP